jgi:4-methyl-5(b-hydroxyethyl)-thiazole monophosphate biosynthesis
MMEKILVFLADGFEEIEALTAVDYLRRADLEVDTVSIKDTKEVTGAHKITVLADKLIDQIDVKDYKLAYVPGGLPGSTNLRDDDKVIEILQEINDRGDYVSAICAGPIVLDKAGILKDKKATSFPGFDKEMENVGTYVDDEIVVVDGNVITGRGAAIAIYQALKIIEILKGKDAADQVKDGIQQDKVEKYFNFKY